MKNEDVIILFDLYSNDLYKFAVSFLGSKHDAEDIVQEVFSKLLNKNMFFEKRNEKAYLLTMAANKCKDHLKASARNDIDLDSEDWHLQYYDGFTEQNKVVFDELMRLEEQFRVPIYLHYYAGYSYKEISQILKLSESAVAARINRGKERLRIRLED